jgi:hypothetical protein
MHAQLLSHNVNGELELMLLCKQHESWIITHMTFFDYHTVTVQYKKELEYFLSMGSNKTAFQILLVCTSPIPTDGQGFRQVYVRVRFCIFWPIMTTLAMCCWQYWH